MTAIVFTRKVLRLLAVPFRSGEVHWASLKLSDNKNKNKTDVIAPHRTQGVRRTKSRDCRKSQRVWFMHCARNALEMAGDLSTSFDACQHKSALEVNYGWRVEGMARRTDFTEKIKTARRLLVIQKILSLTHTCSAFNKVRWSKKNRTCNKIAKQRLSHAVDTKTARTDLILVIFTQ